ncbi:MAG: serine/threonine protein kinase [bacterium]|nr:serine/threonine protein kinase [bacterium]
MNDSERAKSPVRAGDVQESPTAPRPPLSASRIDMITEEFARLLSQRPHRVGDVLAARYRIVDRLGDGGMGEVFVAENLSIGKRVAIKVLKAELLADAAFRQRFQHEAEAIAAVDHPNVVRFFDLVVGDPTFLVMEHLSGPTLAAVLKEQTRLELRRALRIARHLCGGLDAAHRAGVVHRDVKPSNIILVSNEETGEEPKLIDFGVAKVASRPVEQQLTLAGQLVGTPHYMSPEQIMGGQIDARSDVYALGCVLYHLVAGHPPFSANEEFKILSQHVNEAPVPLSRVAAAAPPALDVVIERAMAKAPERRFASTREMAKALAEIEAALAAADRPPPASAAASLALAPRRRRRWVSHLVVAMLAAAAGLGGARLLRFGDRPKPAMAPTGPGGMLLVASDPTGATVELDGAPLAETTPTSVRGVAPGAHTLVIRHGSRPAIARKVELAAGERTLIELTMPPSSHPLELRSTPNGARVYLDRRLVDGVTPLTVAVLDDDLHELRIEKLGYETVVQTVAPDDHDASKSFELAPEKFPRGRLLVDASGNAEVWIDGSDTGFSTPTISMPITLGPHRVEVRLADGSSANRKINVHRGETIRLMLTLPASAPPRKDP